MIDNENKVTIDTENKMRAHLKIFKLKATKQGLTKFQLYPAFCTYYEKHKEKFGLPKFQVLDLACEILVEED